MVVSTDLENRCLTLFIWHKIEIRDEVRVLTCSLKVRFESKIIPRSLTEDTGIKCCPRKGTLMSGTLLKSCVINKQLIRTAPRGNKSEIFRDVCNAGVNVFG